MLGGLRLLVHQLGHAIDGVLTRLRVLVTHKRRSTADYVARIADRRLGSYSLLRRQLGHALSRALVRLRLHFIASILFDDVILNNRKGAVGRLVGWNVD